MLSPYAQVKPSASYSYSYSNALENMEDKEVEDKITELRSLLEFYANRDLDIIRAKRDADPAFFQENDNCFLHLMS